MKKDKHQPRTPEKSSGNTTTEKNKKEEHPALDPLSGESSAEITDGGAATEESPDQSSKNIGNGFDEWSVSWP